jgi:hypothetical protein
MSNDRNQPNRAGVFVAWFLIGLYFLSVGIIALSTAEWPIYLTPIQLDGLHGFFSMFGSKAATYLLGSGMCLLGLVRWIACVIAARPARLHTQVLEATELRLHRQAPSKGQQLTYFTRTD